MSLEVVLAQTAVETYDAIFEQIHDKFGSRAATKFETKVFQILRSVSRTPLIFKATAENPAIRKGWISENCSFFYEVSATHVHILFFWDNRQDTLIE
jgi:plasmid stabilization system protein ParE